MRAGGSGRRNLGLIVQVELDDALPPETVVVSEVRATDVSDPAISAMATDTTTIRLLATFVAEPPAFAADQFYNCDDVNAVVREHFPAQPWTWTLIGRADALRPLAAELGKVTEVRLSDPGFGPR